MLQTIKKIILSSAVFGLFLVPIAVGTGSVSAQLNCSAGIEECVKQGAEATDPNSTGEASERVDGIIKTVINVFSVIVGVVAVVMIIVGGLKYITSAGDSGNVSGAKNTILYAVVGLVIVALAQIIVSFVLERASGGTGA